jgi:hypothetical protein
LENPRVTIVIAFGKTMGYHNGVLEKLWVGVTAFGKIRVSIVTTFVNYQDTIVMAFGKSVGYYNGDWKNYVLV